MKIWTNDNSSILPGEDRDRRDPNGRGDGSVQGGGARNRGSGLKEKNYNEYLYQQTLMD